MTKPSLGNQPMNACDFTIALFCRVDDVLQGVPKPALSHLYPSEVVTVGMLHALRGGGWRAFYRWLCKELKSLFPRLPEQSRLFRLLTRYRHLAQRFLAPESALGVCDTFGIELLHPRREGRCWWHFARKGKSNQRWIVGAKFFVLLNQWGQNQWGQIVRWNCSPANFHDTVFHCEIEDFQETMLVLADKGFHAKEKEGQGDPTNLKICQRGQWNEHMLIETTFSLFEETLDLKKIDRRLRHTLCAHLAYVAAIYNICINWTGKVQLSLIHFAL